MTICGPVAGLVLQSTEDVVAPRIARALKTLAQDIAHGRTDNGRPLGGEKVRQMARDVLTAHGIDW